MLKSLSLRGLLFFTILAISSSCEDPDEGLGGNLGDESQHDRGTSIVDTQQAENRTGVSGCSEKSNHSGFTGSGFMDFGGNGTWIEWNNVTVAAAGEYGLTFRYANGSAGNRQAAAIINGKNAGNVAFSPTGGWPTWKTASVKTTLRKGTNTIRVQANTGSGGPNLDKMDITVSDLCPDDPGKTQPGECGCGVPEGSCGNDKNVARGKPTRQSSTAYRGESSRAVDGNTSGVYGQNSITHTAHTTAPWWIVDLGTSHQVSGVILWNRTDCCSNRLSNFHVDYLDRAGKVIAKKDYPGQVGIRAEIGLSASGVYSVRVQLHGTNPLSLAEVEVQGTAGGGGTSRCAEATEHKSATLSCPSGEKITSIDFASYGLPTGSCDSGFSTGTCHASSSQSKVKAACLNKQSCTVSSSNGTFGDPCPGKSKRLAVTYACSGDGVNDQCPDDPNKTVPGECGCGRPEGTCDNNDEVLPSDTVLVRPDSHGPIIAPITAYTWKDRDNWPGSKYELPIYKTLNRNEDSYWNLLVDELLLSRVDVAMFHGRGCWDLNSGTKGSGDLCPRHLEKLVAAIERAGAEDVLRLGMWDDTGAYNKALQHLENLPQGTKLDFRNRNHWKYFWDHNIKIWFDTIPKRLWYLMDGKPVVAFWTLSDAFFSNQQGNASAMLSWIKKNFKNRYGVEPAFILQENWFENDSTININQAVGKHDWFRPVSDNKSSIYSYRNYNGAKWGAVAPSFRNGGGTTPGCGSSCREVTRRDGETLKNALQAGVNAKFVLLEGWTDMAESAGFYRSHDWRYPAQYINIVRHYSDPEPQTLRFQAEGADRFFDKTNGNNGNHYRDDDLDIGKLGDNSGWFVGWTTAGEWIEYQEVELGCGTYRFTARVATPSTGKKIRLDLNGLASVTLKNTNGFDNYELVHLGEVKLQAGTYNLRILFETGGVNLDWFFMKRENTSCK